MNDLINAYLETDYFISNFKMQLKIGIKSIELEEIFKLSNVKSASYITAYNSYSKILGIAENKKRNEDLCLLCKDYTCIEGNGKHPSNKWEGEPSFLFLGMDLETAKEIGKKYEQNAILWIGEDFIPKLILLNY
jgi:hypothetical protein